MRRTANGPFSAQDLGNGAWYLTAGGAEIYLRTARCDVPDCLKRARVTRLDLEWRDDGVNVVLTADSGTDRIEAETAIIHEPRNDLYESVALAAFDSAAMRFWKGVFRLMRLPGGRFLVTLIARRRR